MDIGPTTTSVSLQPDPKFSGVARSIAKGTPPEWLVVGLTHFSDGIGVNISKKDRHYFNTQIRQMSSSKPGSSCTVRPSPRALASNKHVAIIGEPVAANRSAAGTSPRTGGGQSSGH